MRDTVYEVVKELNRVPCMVKCHMGPSPIALTRKTITWGITQKEMISKVILHNIRHF
jgi:hypothetical protein